MYYIFNGQEKVGPLSLEELKGKGLVLKTEIWREGLSHWVQVRDLPEVVSELQLKTKGDSPSMNAWMIINIGFHLFAIFCIHFSLDEEYGSSSTFYTVMMSVLGGAVLLNVVSILMLFQRKYRLANILSIICGIVFAPIGLLGVIGMHRAIEKVS